MRRLANIPQVGHDKMWEKLTDAARIVEVIFVNGGMATKSAVEVILMARYPGMSHSDAHDAMNTLEFFNVQPNHGPYEDETPPTIDEYCLYMQGVDIRWFDGNPMEEMDWNELGIAAEIEDDEWREWHDEVIGQDPHGGKGVK